MSGWTEAWRRSEIIENRALARGTQLTTFRLPDDLPFPFEPGHVVALRADTPGGPVRHPYTLSFSDPEARSVGIVYRVIPGGRLTPHLAQQALGGLAEIQGLHHQPIQQEVDPEAPAFLGVATGSGAGPLVGFALQAMGAGFDRPFTLLLGYREQEDIICARELGDLAAEHPNFRWIATLSQPSPAWSGLKGHVTGHLSAQLAASPGAHVHLVGNMAMIRTVEAALDQAGWPARRVTHEGFFNWNAQADGAEALRLAKEIRTA